MQCKSWSSQQRSVNCRNFRSDHVISAGVSISCHDHMCRIRFGLSGRDLLPFASGRANVVGRFQSRPFERTLIFDASEASDMRKHTVSIILVLPCLGLLEAPLEHGRIRKQCVHLSAFKC